MKKYSRLSSAAVVIGALRVKGVLEVVGWVTLPDSNHNESKISSDQSIIGCYRKRSIGKAPKMKTVEFVNRLDPDEISTLGWVYTTFSLVCDFSV